MHQSAEELLSEMQTARTIIDQYTDIRDLPIVDLLNALDDGSYEMRHYRWNIAAILYVEKIDNYSYDYLATELVTHNFPEYLCEHIMFLLQKEHDICSIKLLKVALQHETFLQIFPFVQKNIRYEGVIEKDNITDFFYILPSIPSNKEYYLFSDFSQKIVENSLEDYAFTEIINSKPEKSKMLLPFLLEHIYNQSADIGDFYLSTLFHSTEAIFWIDSIVAGLGCSLRNHVDIFERYFRILQEISLEKQAWKKLIPCYVEYVFCHGKNEDIYRSVLDTLRIIEKSLEEEKLIFIRTIAYQKDISAELEIIRQSICKTAFEKKEEVLAAMEDYYYHFRSKLSTADVLKELHSTFIVNGYNNTCYHEFFKLFKDLLSEYSDRQYTVWQYFMYVLYDRKEESVAFAIGLFEYAITFSESVNQIFEFEINEKTACLTVKLLSALSIHCEQVCIFSFEIARFLSENSQQYIETIYDDIYTSYPYTCQKTAQNYVDSSFYLQQKVARRIVNRYQREYDEQKQWHTIPDLWPSMKRQMIAQNSSIQQNKRINKMAQKESIFAQLFSNHMMKYGKRSGYIRHIGHNNYTYQTNEYMSFETSMELSETYTKTPVEWYLSRREVLEERRKYIEAYC